MKVMCYHSVPATELRNISFRRVGDSCCQKVTTRDEVRAVGHNLSGEFGGQCVRGDWRGRYGVSRKLCFLREGLGAMGIRAGGSEQSGEGKEELKICVRCGMAFRDEDNSPVACKYHGHMTDGECKRSISLHQAVIVCIEHIANGKAMAFQLASHNLCWIFISGDSGLYSLAPPHQGIDGEWTDASGVIIYKWNDENERPSTGSKNWKRRWTCCGVYAEDAVPCLSGRHVSYDDGATRF